MILISIEIDPEDPALKPYTLMREHVLPALEARRAAFNAMYSPVIGRPETDPVLLAAILVFQTMERLTDRECVETCKRDAYWKYALGEDLAHCHHTTLWNFRNRLLENKTAQLAFEACLEAMRNANYFKHPKALRVDSTHLLARIANMSRLECVRETLRLALDFLAAFEGPENWEPWHARYADQNPAELRKAAPERLASHMEQAGNDMREILERAEALGENVAQAKPVLLLRRVFSEPFEPRENAPAQRDAAPPGAVVNPHDPEAQWSTKATLGKSGWQGYKAQVCETIPETKCARGEPTRAVITAVVVQPAITSDHGSHEPVLAQHAAATGFGMPDESQTDAGYISAPALLKAKAGGYELTGPVPAPPHSGKRFGSDAFDVDLPNRTATCPAGHASSECSAIRDAHNGVLRYYFAWPAKTCAACPLRAQCLSTKGKHPRRSLEVGEHHMLLQERRRLCLTDAYRQRMKRRAAIEGTHSELVRGYGFRRCRYRGLARTQLQSFFTAAACNLRRWSARLNWEARQTP